MNTDCIEKHILLRAPRKRVWQALTDSSQFGYWFGVKFDGPFELNHRVTGIIVPSQADPEMGKAQKPYEGVPFECVIAKIEPERLFAFRWRPYAVDRGTDPSSQPTTLVEFVLEEMPDGTVLTVTESGFDQIPLAQRAKAFAGNEQGWSMQMKAIEKYITDATHSARQA